MIRSAFALTALTLAIAPAARAEDTKEMPIDGRYFEAAAEGCQALVRYSEIAEGKATAAAVKDLATKTKECHQMMQKAFAKYSEDRKIAVAAGTSTKTSEVTDRLKSLEGDEFDREYVRVITKMSDEHLKMCEHQANHGTDNDLKEIATKSVEKLKALVKYTKELPQNPK